MAIRRKKNENKLFINFFYYVLVCEHTCAFQCGHTLHSSCVELGGMVDNL